MSEQIGLTALDWIAIIGALGGLATILGGIALSIVKVWKADVDSKLAIIQHSVDGTASTQEAKLNTALDKLEFMTAQVNKEEKKAEVLAATLVPLDEKKNETGHVPVVIEKNKDK